MQSAERRAGACKDLNVNCNLESSDTSASKCWHQAYHLNIQPHIPENRPGGQLRAARSRLTSS